MAKLTLAGIQMDVVFADKGANLARISQWMKTAGEEAGAGMVVVPECAVTGYCFDSKEEALEVAEAADGPACQELVRRCQELNQHLVYGYLETDGEHLFNAINLVGPAGLVGTYRKTHLPYLGVDRFTDRGTDPYQVHQAGDVNVGMLICYDCSFPEPNRILGLAGADVIALPTNWPPGSGCTADYVPNTRALENNVYYMAINRVGTERGFDFIGKSKICDPNGFDLVVAQDEPVEEMLVAEMDPAKARKKRLARVPGKHEIDRFADRRPDLYEPLSRPVESWPGHGR